MVDGGWWMVNGGWWMVHGVLAPLAKGGKAPRGAGGIVDGEWL